MFTEEKIIEPLMDHYKDFNYVNYILNTDFETAYKLFLKLNERILNIIEEKSQDRAFSMFLTEKLPGLNFKNYYENIKKQAENSKMTIKDKDNEEKRILEKYSNIDINDLKRKEF